MPRDFHETKTASKSKSRPAAPLIDRNDSSSSLKHAPSSSTVTYPSSMAHHHIGYNGYMGMNAEGPPLSSAPASDCPWNSYDNVPPTPAPAFPDDPQGYDFQPNVVYIHRETAPGASPCTDSAGFEASLRPSTPMGALATPPNGYEWYISSAYRAYLVPLEGTSSASAPLNSTYTGTISIVVAPYGLPTPPPEADISYRYSRISSGRRGLPEWVAANPGRELVDVLDERDHVWTRGKARRH